MADPALYRLLAWLSPAYPVGAFGYSHGLEWAIEEGSVRDAESLRAWLIDILRHGGGRNDAVLFAQAYRAAVSNDQVALGEIVELALALSPSRERRLETTAQGNAFLKATRAAWACTALDRLASAAPGAVPYPVAVAVAAAGHGIALEPALAAYLQAFMANLISAGVRLVPLGQTAGLRVLAALETEVAAVAAAANAAPLDAVGGAAIRADLASMRHETQHTRLFRS
ncbi:MAG: urease accessory protein UreF [Pseudomonadota bacterium]